MTPTLTRILRGSGAMCVALGLLLSAELLQGATRPPSAPAPALTRADARTLFEQGNRLFREGLEASKNDKKAGAVLFRDAGAAWRTIALEGGIRNAALETNIANASLLAGDTPRAIAAFRRAQAIDPFSVPIREGLAAARRAAGTETLAPGVLPPEKADEAASRGFSGTARRVGAVLAHSARRTLLYLPEHLMLWTSAIAYLGAFALFGLGALRVGRFPRWIAPTLLVVSVLAAGPLVARDLAASPEGVVITAGTIGRNGPADLYEPAFQEALPAGLEVRVLEQRQGWSRVRLTDGRTAWIPGASLERL